MVVEISSRDNPFVKEYIKLKTNKKHRKNSSRVAVEGPNLVFEALNSGYIPDLIFLTKTYLEKDCAKIKAMLPPGIKALIVNERLFKLMADTDAPQEVAAIFNFSYLVAENASAEHKGPVLILDRISDPGNVGTIIRTAAAAGASKVIYTDDCADPYGPKALRATAGAIFRLKPELLYKPLEFLPLLKKKGFQVVAANPGNGLDYRSVDYSNPTALIIGKESEGVSVELSFAADIEVTIPLQGGVDSLNAAVAAGILLFEVIRSRNNHCT